MKSLTALVVAMTLGTFVLMLLELKADPLRPAGHQLAKIAHSSQDLQHVVSETEVPVQPMRWDHVIVHSATSANHSVAQGSHFTIRPDPNGRGYQVMASDYWNRQQPGRHAVTRVFDYNHNSIGICLIGDFSARAPSREQYAALVTLVHELRRQCRIVGDRVYLARELPLPRRSPGKAFPAKLFAHDVR